MGKPKEVGNIHWLSDDEYAKAVYSLRATVTSLFKPLRRYGQDVYCDQAIEHTIKLCEDFGLRVRGVDHPIETELTARSRYESEHNLSH
jgi:hypothetical protein